MEEQILNIINEMSDYLNVSQLKLLQETLVKHLSSNRSTKTCINRVSKNGLNLRWRLPLLRWVALH